MTRYTLDRGRYPRAWRKNVLYTEQQLRHFAERLGARLEKQASGRVHAVHSGSGKVLAVYVEVHQDDETAGVPDRLRMLATLKLP